MTSIQAKEGLDFMTEFYLPARPPVQNQNHHHGVGTGFSGQDVGQESFTRKPGAGEKEGAAGEEHVWTEADAEERAQPLSL